MICQKQFVISANTKEHATPWTGQGDKLAQTSKGRQVQTMQIPDNYDRWASHDAEQERQLQKLPECCCCSEHIQDDHFFLINDEIVCEGCLNEFFRKDVEDYVS